MKDTFLSLSLFLFMLGGGGQRAFDSFMSVTWQSSEKVAGGRAEIRGYKFNGTTQGLWKRAQQVTSCLCTEDPKIHLYPPLWIFPRMYS